MTAQPTAVRPSTPRSGWTTATADGPVSGVRPVERFAGFAAIGACCFGADRFVRIF